MAWNLGEGTFEVAKLKSAFLKESKTGNGMVIVGLQVQNETIYWQGVLSEKTAQKTLATIARLGYGHDCLTEIANDDLTVDDLFPSFPEGRVEVVVEEEEYEVDGETRTTFRAKWLNIAGYNDGSAGMTQEEVMKKKKIFSFEGDLAKFMNEVKTVNLKRDMEKPKQEPMMKKTEEVDPPSGTALDDLPF